MPGAAWRQLKRQASHPGCFVAQDAQAHVIILVGDDSDKKKWMNI